MSVAEADVTELPASPGARLRREREARGLTQQQAAEQLTLDISVIVALESNDFASLGAPVFAKGHLRRYAALLDLPQDDLLGGYERSKAQPEQPTLVPRSRFEMAPVRGPSRWPYVVGGAAAVLLAAGLVAYVGANGWRLPWGRAGKTQVAVSNAAAPQAPTAQGAVTPPPEAGTAQGAPTATADGTAPVTALPAGQVNLQLHFTTDSWVEIYDGTGKAVLYDLGKSGTDRAVTAVAPLSVTIGNAPAVRVAVNGRALTPPPLPAGQTVARFSVGPDGSVR
jgi:cytoskeleton protein RodZ